MTDNPYRNTEAFQLFLVELDNLSSGLSAVLQNPQIIFTERQKFQSTFHRIKGVAGMFGYGDLGLIASKLEDFCKSCSETLCQDSEILFQIQDVVQSANEIITENKQIL